MEILTYKCPKCLVVTPLRSAYELVHCSCGQSQFDPLSHVHLGARNAPRPAQGRAIAQALAGAWPAFFNAKTVALLGFVIFASLVAYPTYRAGMNLYTAAVPIKLGDITISGLAFSDAGGGNYLLSASINNPTGLDIDWPNIKVELTKQGSVVLTKVITPDEYLRSSISLEIPDAQGKLTYQALTNPQDLVKLRNGRFLIRSSLNLPGAQAAEADNYRLALEPRK